MNDSARSDHSVKQLAGYIRVSRTNGRKGASFISPEVQREAIEGWAEARGHKITAWHEELDKSAGAGKERPVFDELMAAVMAGDVDGIVVWKFSRFGRSLIESALRLQKIEAVGGVVESATEGDQSKLTRNIMLAIAEDELDRLREGWSNARKRAIDRGAFVGMAPLGYRKGEGGVLEPDPDMAPIVQRAYRAADTGGAAAAAQYLESANLPEGRRRQSKREPQQPRRARTRWTTANVRRLLASRVYLGEIEHGDAGVNRNAHPALIDVTTWLKVNGEEVRGREASAQYPLSGLARCAGCGGNMVGQVGHARKDGTVPRRYRCSLRWNAGEECSAPASVMAEPLEGIVTRALVDHALNRVEDDGNEAAEERVRELENQLAAAEAARLADAEDLELEELLGPDAYRARLAKRAAVVNRLTAELREANKPLTAGEVVDAVVLGRQAGGEPDPVTLRRAAAQLIERVDVSRGSGPLEDRVRVIFR